MFCPDCESEYREGVTRCADCDVPLVEELGEPERPTDDAVIVPLTETRDAWLVEALVDRLEKANVPYVITAGTALPLLDRPDEPLSPPLEWEARILVQAELYDRARRIYQQLKPTAP